MAKDFLKSDPIADLEAQLNSDFNTVIRKAHRSLGTKKLFIQDFLHRVGKLLILLQKQKMIF